MVNIYNLILENLSKLHMKPNFMIIGTQKGGTTSLFHYLIQHPNILPPRQLKLRRKLVPWLVPNKELYYFNKEKLKNKYFYERNFPSIIYKIINKKYITGEATPGYLFRTYSPKNIKKLYPKTKFIVLLRDPISRAYSAYKMFTRNGTEQNNKLESALKREEKEHRFAYKQRGKYSEQLRNWFKYFNKEQFLILESEEFHKNPDKIFKEVCHFLNIPYKKVNYNFFNVGHYKDIIPNKIKEELKIYFKPYNKELKQLIGKEFSWMKNYD